ncbi:MAG: hypothetical protein COB90_09380 [Hyphomicrobiales bacterium]|nr:MAG: hypothetical protein COB90_09380 [Hyphomicrobiales bacterium]
MTNLFKKHYKKLRKSYVRRTKDKFVHEVPNLGKLLLNAQDSQGRDIYAGNLEEHEDRAIFQNYLANNTVDVFLDIGANFGLYTLIASQYKIDEMHAFEPNSSAYNQLCGNLFLNNLSGRVQPWKYAVSDKKGTTTLYIDPSATEVSTLSPENMPDRWEYSNKTSCKTTTIDLELDIKNKAIFAKIDVEGHEEKALIGMKTLLQENKVRLMIEILDNHDRILSILNNWGYKLLCRSETNFHLENQTT